MLDRDIGILRSVVDLFVLDGEPVSSHRVKEATGLLASTATIRNSMARLERKGYLLKPHTSGGRVPTDIGYRAYVEHLEANEAYGDLFADRFRWEIRDLTVDIHTILAAASRILGGLSRNFAVVYGAVVQESRVSAIRLIVLEGSRLLVVVTLNPDYERTAVIKLERVFPIDVIARVEERINRAVEGRTLQQAKEALDAFIRDNFTDEGIVARDVASHRDAIFSEPPAVELYFEERDHLLEQPEFADPRLLQLLLRLLRDRAYLTSILAERVDEPPRITIGGENRDEELQSFSLVTSGYRMGTTRGVLGVIGPTRMRYGLVWTLVGAAARELEAVGEEYF